MRSITITVDEADFARLAEEAARRGRPVADLVRDLARDELARSEQVGREARALFAELRAEPSELTEEEAMRIAIEEVRAMRAERRAAGRL
jgi:hypothetical protein